MLDMQTGPGDYTYGGRTKRRRSWRSTLRQAGRLLYLVWLRPSVAPIARALVVGVGDVVIASGADAHHPWASQIGMAMQTTTTHSPIA